MSSPSFPVPLVTKHTCSSSVLETSTQNTWQKKGTWEGIGANKGNYIGKDLLQKQRPSSRCSKRHSSAWVVWPWEHQKAPWRWFWEDHIKEVSDLLGNHSTFSGYLANWFISVLPFACACELPVVFHDFLGLTSSLMTSDTSPIFLTHTKMYFAQA